MRPKSWHANRQKIAFRVTSANPATSSNSTRDEVEEFEANLEDEDDGDEEKQE